MNIWDSLLEGLGAILAFFYDVIPSYGVAIILLTILVRVVLLPLTIRQTRSMQAMQSLQPKVKELQRKYKGNRQKLNEETMKLYKEHQVNPLGGCLPLLLQLPVFFALFSVLRSTIPALAVPAEPVPVSQVNPETTVCVPNTDPSVDGPSPTAIVCENQDGETQTLDVSEWEDPDTGETLEPAPSSLFSCRPQPSGEDESEADRFLCETPLGTKHVPADSELFAAIVEDRAEVLGVELACSPTQALNDVEIRRCAGPDAQAGVATAIPYFVLVALMVGTTFYQQKQMQKASAGPAQQQQQLMGRIMPIFLGVISISISAGVLVYWVTTNAWQIGQQHLMLRRREAEALPAKGSAKGSGPTKGSSPTKGSDKTGQTPKPSKAVEGDGSKVKGSGGRRAGSRKKRRKR
jgi:YidC/Oxa1 family membrane protein insertase